MHAAGSRSTILTYVLVSICMPKLTVVHALEEIAVSHQLLHHILANNSSEESICKRQSLLLLYI
jgi:hypothetical protein